MNNEKFAALSTPIQYIPLYTVTKDKQTKKKKLKSMWIDPPFLPFYIYIFYIMKLWSRFVRNVFLLHVYLQLYLLYFFLVLITRTFFKKKAGGYHCCFMCCTYIYIFPFRILILIFLHLNVLRKKKIFSIFLIAF